MKQKQQQPSLIAIFLYYVLGSTLLSFLLNYIFYGRERWSFYMIYGGLFAVLMTCIEKYRRRGQ